MLYIVGTPLGNLKDLSIRQTETLLKSDIILAEDTRSAQNLLNYIRSELSHFFATWEARSDVGRNGREPIGATTNGQRATNVISYYKDVEFEKLPEVMEYLREDKVVSLISESGMPILSDPGLLLVKQVIKENIPFEVIPGPTAVTTALVYAGFNPQQFMFIGFLLKKESEIKKLFSTIQPFSHLTIPIVFYESPHRINKTLELLDTLYPDADVCICRELTKKFEEIIRGKPGELAKREYKGEITGVLVI